MSGPRYSQAGLQALKHGVAAFRAGDRIVPAHQARELLAAVEDLPPKHDCPGIYDCIGHPRWYVWRGRTFGRWHVGFRERWIRGGSFDTHAEAVAYATVRARADQLAHLEAQPGEVCS